MIKLLECRYLGCTLATARALGVNAQINARGGELWRNDTTLDEIEMNRDGQRIKDRIASRVSFYQVCSKFFRKNRAQISHLISDHNEN